MDIHAVGMILVWRPLKIHARELWTKHVGGDVVSQAATAMLLLGMFLRPNVLVVLPLKKVNIEQEARKTVVTDVVTKMEVRERM